MYKPILQQSFLSLFHYKVLMLHILKEILCRLGHRCHCRGDLHCSSYRLLDGLVLLLWIMLLLLEHCSILEKLESAAPQIHDAT